MAGVRLSAVFSSAPVVGLTSVPFSEAVVATSPDEVSLAAHVIETDPEGVATSGVALDLPGDLVLNAVTVRMSKVTTPSSAVVLGLMPVHWVSLDLEIISSPLELG